MTERSVILSNALKQKLQDKLGEQTFAELIADSLTDQAINGKGVARIQAAREISDRTEGKPLQKFQVENPIDERTARLILELANRLLVPSEAANEGFKHPIGCPCAVCQRPEKPEPVFTVTEDFQLPAMADQGEELRARLKELGNAG